MTPNLPTPPRALTITADDFGFGVATSRGIVRAHRAGVVTSASLMAVTGDHAAASVALLADAPALDVGLHLVLTGPAQRPLAVTRSSGLVARDGAFHPLPKLLWLAWRRRLDPAAVLDEICAQADKATSLLGRPPAYVDGHHHAHQVPVVREALVAAIRSGHLPPLARLTVEPAPVRRHVRHARLRRHIMHRIGLAAAPVFRAAGIATNDSCFGMIGPRQLADPLPWQAYLPHLPPADHVEWFIHPGEPDDSLAGRDSYLAPRAVELDALLRLAEHPDWPRWSRVLVPKSAARSEIVLVPQR